MVISVNNMRKSSGATTFSIALSVFLAEATDLSILLIDANFLYSDLNDIFGIEPDRGIDDILDLAISNKLTEGVFKDIVINLGSVNMLTGSKIIQYNRYETEEVNYEKVFNIAQSLYDIIIVDSAPKKMQSYLDNMAKEEKSYLNIQVCKQNFLALERYITSKSYNMDKSIIVINEYDDNKKLNKQSMVNNYKLTVPIFLLRKSEKLFEYFNDKKIDIYLLNESDAYIYDIKVILNYISEQYKFLLKPNYILKPGQNEEIKKKKGLFW